MVFIFWLNWDLIENNNSFPLSFHPHPEKKLFLIFQYEKKAGIYYGFHFFLGQNFKQGTHSIIIFLKLEIGWFPVQMVIIKHECLWHIATVSEKLNINSIGLKSNQTFQWHLPSPCDIKQPLYLSSSHDWFCFNPTMIVPYPTTPYFKTNQALFICESFWTISHSQHIYVLVYMCLNTFLYTM